MINMRVPNTVMLGDARVEVKCEARLTSNYRHTCILLVDGFPVLAWNMWTGEVMIKDRGSLVERNVIRLGLESIFYKHVGILTTTISPHIVFTDIDEVIPSTGQIFELKHGMVLKWGSGDGTIIQVL